jgi:uncharacterized protein YbaR (Trm112 family)
VFVELVDALRCPRPHEATWLVLANHNADGRHVVEGVLGCPACGAEYPIVEGVPLFGSGPEVGALRAPASGPTPASSGGSGIDPDEVMRAAALLHLMGSGGIVLLTGAWRAFAAPLFDLLPAQYVLLDPRPAVPDPRDEREGISIVAADGCIPFGAGALRAAAVEGAYARPPLLARVLQSLKPRGRLVLPAGESMPSDVRELAADDRHRVGEVVVVGSGVVALRRGGKGEPGGG